jgi:N-methylhydantoinase B
MIDGDGLGNGPFRAVVKVTISDDRFTVDYTGTDPQAPGSINTTRSGMSSFVRAVFIAVTAPHIPVNGGMFRPLEVICPAGTLFTAERPAPTSVYWETGNFAVDLVWQAMAPHVPGRLPAGCYLTVGSTNIWGTHPDTGEFYLLVEPLAGGWGAGWDRDGDNGQFCPANGETYNIPIEVAETRYGVQVERYTFNDDDGGAGEFRGGKGLIIDYRCLSKAWLTSILGRHKFPPWGMSGGREGSPNRIRIIRKDGRIEEYGKTARLPLAEGDVVRMVTGNGGGFGDPGKRPRDKVLEDVRNGYVTREQAERDYGLRPADR